MQLQLRQILSLTKRDFINKGFTFLSTLYKTSNKYYERRYNAHNVLKFQNSRPWSCILCGWTCNLSTLYIYSRTDGCMTWKLRGLRYVYIISSRRFNPKLESFIKYMFVTPAALNSGINGHQFCVRALLYALQIIHFFIPSWYF